MDNPSHAQIIISLNMRERLAS